MGSVHRRHPYWWYALVFERDLGGPNAWGFAGLLQEEPRQVFGYLLHLQGGFLFLEDMWESAFVYARDPTTNLFTEVQTLPYRDFFPTALRVRDGLVARAGVAGSYASGYVSALRIHRRSSGPSRVPELALVTDTLFPDVQHDFYGIDVQGERVALGAPEEDCGTGEVLVVDLACPRAQVPLALAPR